MPSILDFLEDPNLLSSVMGGGMGAPGQPPQQPKPPPPPPPAVMAQAPKQFGPGGAVDGGLEAPLGGGPPIQMPGAVPMPQPKPMSFAPPQPPGMSFADRAGPVSDAITNGRFDPQGMNSTDFNLSPQNAMAYAATPQKGDAFPSLTNRNDQDIPITGPTLGGPKSGMTPTGQNPAMPLPQPKPAGFGDDAPKFPEPTINRTARNGVSIDQESVDRGAQPLDIRPPAQSGKLDPRVERTRAFGNFMQGLGKGLSAVGSAPRGASGAQMFASGAGGAMQGYGENERHNQDRDDKREDRADRRRQQDQTADYHNRTLAANTDYHNKLITESQLKRMDARDRERWTPVGRDENGLIVYSDRNSGEERTGDIKNAPLNPRGDGPGGGTERLAQLLIQDAAKRGETITLEQAVKLARGSRDGNGEPSRAQLERLAQQGHANQENVNDRNTPKLTLDQWRQRYGLPPFPQPGQNGPLTSQKPVPFLNGPGAGPTTPQWPVPGQPGPAPAPAPASAPKPAAPPSKKDQSKPPPSGLTPSGRPSPPLPPGMPEGSLYSESRNAWRTPDGQLIPAQ